MIKVKAKRTVFVVDIGVDIEVFTYDSQRKPTNRQLLDFVFKITGMGDIKLVSRETYEITLSMPFNKFYQFAHIDNIKKKGDIICLI